MATTRLAAIPFEHVEAELAAFPIGSETSFRCPFVCLEPLTSRQANLARAAEREILASMPSIPLDEFMAMRDKVWFFDRPDREDAHAPVPLVRYLRRLSEEYLDELGRPVDGVASAGEERRSVSSRARLRWSWLCRALPPDLLRVARGIRPTDESSFVLSPAIDRLLGEDGYAETHLHLGAAADFPLLWANFMRALAEEEIPRQALSSGGACFEEGNGFATWVLWAAVVRLLLAERLFDAAGPRPDVGLPDFGVGTRSGRLDAGMINDVSRLVSEFEQGRPGTPALRFARGRAMYRLLIRRSAFGRHRGFGRGRVRGRGGQESRKEVFDSDPMARVVGWQREMDGSPEAVFLERALRHLEVGEDGGEFGRLFWQMVRVRCLLYRHLVQRPMTPGLQWFVRFFSRIRAVRRELSPRVTVEAALRWGGSDAGCGRWRSASVRTRISRSAEASWRR